jgi:hypothetical protein
LSPIYVDPFAHKYTMYRLAEDTIQPPQILMQFGEGIALNGLRVTAAQRLAEPAGWNVGLYLRWGPRAAIPKSYKVFVHVVDEQGQLVAQDDSVPGLGTNPTSTWRAGETLIDYHALTLTAPVPAQLTVLVGLYDPDTGQRLPRLDGSGQPVDDKANLGVFSVVSNPRFKPAS